MSDEIQFNIVKNNPMKERTMWFIKLVELMFSGYTIWRAESDPPYSVVVKSDSGRKLIAFPSPSFPAAQKLVDSLMTELEQIGIDEFSVRHNLPSGWRKPGISPSDC